MNRRSIAAGKGHVEIGIRNRIARGARGVQSDLDKLGKNLRGQARRLASIGGTISAAAIGPLALVIRKASEMQETMGKFGVVFGDAAKSVEAWSDTTADAMGVSEQAMAGMLSGMQDLLVPMGVADDLATDMSKELSALAVDLASFNNMESAKTFEDLMAAMTGSGEVMKKYGVILTETAVKQELLRMGLDPKTTDNAAKAQARLNIIMRGTTAAQGDAIRTSGSFANQMKAMWSIVTDVSGAIGGPLLDDLAGMVGLINHAGRGIKSFVNENQELVRMVGMAVIAVGGIGGTLLAAGATAAVVGFAFSGLATAIGLLMSPIALAIGGIGAIGFALVKYTDIGGDAVDWLASRFGPLVETVQGALGAIMEALRSGDIDKAWSLTVEMLELTWLDMTEGIRSAWGATMGYILDAGSVTAGAIGEVFQGLATVLTSILESYQSVYDKIFNLTSKGFNALGESITGVKTIGGPVEPKGSAFEDQFGAFKTQIEATIENVRNFGVQMENTALQQVGQRADERRLASEQRQARRQELQESLQVATVQAQQSKDAREELEKRLAGELKIEPAEIEALSELKQNTGPTGTFSAVGAAIAGNSQSIDKKMLGLTEQVNTSLKSIEKTNDMIAKAARNNSVARFA